MAEFLYRKNVGFPTMNHRKDALLIFNSKGRLLFKACVYDTTTTTTFGCSWADTVFTLHMYDRRADGRYVETVFTGGICDVHRFGESFYWQPGLRWVAGVMKLDFLNAVAERNLFTIKERGSIDILPNFAGVDRIYVWRHMKKWRKPSDYV